jgi:diguanylate cyclase (GGDEF)-like protein/PAS domain S-box-containing protein
MKVKPKSAGKKTRNDTAGKNDLSNLSEDIISHAGVGIYIVQHGNFVYVSPLFQKLSGYSEKEIIGLNPLDFLHPDDREMVREKATKCLKGENPGSYEYRFVRHSGDLIRVLERVTSITYKGERSTLGSFMDVTERKQAEESARFSTERYRNILETIEDGYFEVDLSGNYTFVNDVICRDLKYSREELIGMNNRQFQDEENARKTYRFFADIYKEGKSVRTFEIEVIRKDGTRQVSEVSISPIRDAEGKTIGFRGTSRDISERKQMEETIRQSEERYRTIIEEMEEWYFETDLSGRILFFNDVFVRSLGYSQKDLTGLSFRNFFREKEADSVYRVFHQIFDTGLPIRNFPYEFVRPDGGITFAEFSIFPKKDQEGRLCGFRGVGHDITARKQAEERIQYLATHDALTDLPNRLMFNQLLKHAIRSAQRYQRRFALLFIDLDRFKIINDTLGHDAGDQLLQEISVHFQQELRAVDIVARLGGDEFVILIEEVSDVSQIAAVAQKILSAARKPVSLIGQECRVTASIGICIYPDDADDEQSLMKNADIAMYYAKQEGKNSYQFYSKDIKSKSIEGLLIETNLRFALERNELSLLYQAKLDFKTGAITGVEALLRWQNTILGPVTPGRFIHVAEETGLIVPIGRWVLKTVCAQNVAWQRQGLPPICMAVNLSLRQLTDENLIDDIGKALTDSGMAPNLLELEITESMIMQNPAQMIAVLAGIKRLGVRLAIDDFGIGYSSLAQIKHFTVDTLKVARSFIRNLPHDPEDKVIIEAIISMGKSLSLTIVAEGVETKEQENFLREHACDEMQGFYFSKPATPEAFADLLRKHVSSIPK